MHKFNQTYLLSNSISDKIPPIHFKNLNALRFFAASSVFFFHFMREISHLYPALKENLFFKIISIFSNKGLLGVNFFFVLSGFLITYLMLHEIKYAGNFNLKHFLIRRSLRIWPLYFIIGAFGFLLFPLLFKDYHTDHNGFNYFFFLANFDELWNGENDGINFLTAPWSVAVEEQFYLFWGIMIYSLQKIKWIKIQWVIGVCFLTSILFVGLNFEHDRILYYHTFAVVQDILGGAFLGLMLFNGSKLLTKIRDIKKLYLSLIYALGLSICLLKNKIFIDEFIIFERPLLSLFFIFIILDQIHGKHSLFKVGKYNLFNYLGKISYGIYMYHLVLFYLMNRFISFESLPPTIGVILYFIIATVGLFIVSSLSYRYIESKFLNLKPKR